MRDEVLRRSAATLATRALATGLTFAMHVLVARLLGAAGTGVFFLSLAIARGAVEFGRFGLHQSVIGFVAPALREGDRAGAARFAGSGGVIVLALATAAAAALSAFCALALPAAAPERADVWALTTVFAWSAAPLTLLGYLCGVPEAMSRPAAASFLEAGAIPSLTGIGLLAAAATGTASSAVAAALYMAASALAAAAAAALTARGLGAAPRMTRREAAMLLSASHPLVVVNIAGYAVQYAPLLILGAFGSVAEAGIYSLIQRMTMALSILLTAVNGVMRSRFAVAWREGRIDRLQADLDAAGLMPLGAGVPAIVVLTIFAPEALALVGPEFVDGALALTVLLAGQLVNMATASTGAVLAMTGHERLLRRNNVIAAACCTALSAGLIPFHVMLGAALALSASIALQSVLSAVQARRAVGVLVLTRSMVRKLFRGGRS